MDFESKVFSREISQLLWEMDKTVSTAESCTGGRIAEAIIAVPGASKYFKGGIISYVDEVKMSLLGVSGDLLAEKTAVCEEVAQQMVKGACKTLNTDYAIAATGIAGPGGAEPGKPVGTVFMGVSNARGTTATRFQFEGDRNNVRRATVHQALIAFLNELDSASQGE